MNTQNICFEGEARKNIDSVVEKSALFGAMYKNVNNVSIIRTKISVYLDTVNYMLCMDNKNVRDIKHTENDSRNAQNMPLLQT